MKCLLYVWIDFVWFVVGLLFGVCVFSSLLLFALVVCVCFLGDLLIGFVIWICCPLLWLAWLWCVVFRNVFALRLTCALIWVAFDFGLRCLL